MWAHSRRLTATRPSLMLEGMNGPVALALGWGYAEGDPRWVGAIVIALAIAAVVFLALRFLRTPGNGPR